MYRSALIFIVSAAVLFVSGCGKGNKVSLSDEKLAELQFAERYENLPMASGGFSFELSGEVITADEVVEPLVERFVPVANQRDMEEFAQIAAPHVANILRDKISDILLYQSAKKAAPAGIDEMIEKSVNEELKRFVLSFDGDYGKAEQELKRMGLTWEGFRDYQKRSILSQSYMHSHMKDEAPITLSDLRAKYESVKGEFAVDAEIQFQLIEIDPAKMEAEEASTEADRLAWELVARLEAGEDFGELAREYSHGFRARGGGRWPVVKPESLASPYDRVADEVMDIEVGEVAGPMVIDDKVFLAKLLYNQPGGYESFESVQEQMERRIRIERRRAAMDKLSERLMEQAEMGDIDPFFRFCIQRLYNLSRNAG